MLLLVASRRKGELVPGFIYRFLGNRGVVIIIFLLYLFILLFHGFVIWQSPAAKATGILVGLLVIGLTLNMLRKGAFGSRMVVELRDDQREGSQSLLAVIDGGEVAAVDLDLTFVDSRHEVGESNSALTEFSKLSSLSLQLPHSKTRELKVWVHQLTAEGDAGELPALAVVTSDQGQHELELTAAEDQAILPLDVEPGQLKITIQKP